MSNSFPPLSVVNPLRRNRTPGEAEFNALLNLLPDAALVVDTVREQIIQANSVFLQLTAFSLSEIAGRAIQDLFPDLPASFNNEDPLVFSLERRGRPSIQVSVQAKTLDAAGQWRVLICKPVDTGQQKIAQRMDKIIQALSELNKINPNAALKRVLQNALEIVQKLLDVDVIGVYLVNPADSTVIKLHENGDANILPERIQTGDFLRLSQTFIWRPGRRVQTELHRVGRVNNLRFVASTLIDQNALMVVADHQHEPFDQLGMLLEMFGERVGALMCYSAQYHELREQALEGVRDLLVWRQIAENAAEGILLLAPDLTINEINPAAEWMLGYADWEVKGQPVENVLIGPERLGPTLETACQGIPTHNMGHVSLHRRNGQSFPAHIQVIPVQREGDLLALMVFFSDVSEHEEIRERTQQLEQRAVLGEVTAVFAHEVRNPINNISTGLQLLSVKLPPNDPNQENITRLINDCQRLDHLMESVLNFSRHTEHKFEEVDLEGLLKRILDRWRPRMAKVDVVYHFQVEENTPHVYGDPRSLEQVFTNLISNAIEAMSNEGGILAVKIRPYNTLPEHPQVEVTVSDTGPGIPDEIRDRIFEPFITTKRQGTGLGLAITKRIVTAHRGSIQVNTFPGGTLFYVTLSAYPGEPS